MKYSDFSQQLAVCVESEEVNATKDMEFTVNINENSAFTWTNVRKDLTSDKLVFLVSLLQWKHV